MNLKLYEHRIALLDGEKEIGEITWVKNGETLTVDHTFVDPAYQGQGLARQLVDACVEMARAKHYKIIPLCPYVKRVFEKSDEYNDVWAKSV